MPRKGYSHTLETRAKLRAARLGAKHSAETIAKIQATILGKHVATNPTNTSWPELNACFARGLSYSQAAAELGTTREAIAGYAFRAKQAKAKRHIAQRQAVAA